MASEVLVLNRDFYAINVVPWQRALALAYGGHANIVDQDFQTYSFEDWKELSQLLSEHPAGFIHTPSFKIALPEVIALRVFDKLPRMEVSFTRRNIYEHYGYRCCYCGKRFVTKELNLEHVLPRSRGGKTDWKNIVTACLKCNLKKGNKLPEEAGMRLLIKPSKPPLRSRTSILIKSPIPIRASWQKFIDNAYWNARLEE